uniref:exocyst complex component 6 isoform X3 n=1 Tax=Ciona intestinalis TaxID=7719 RepID=UPI000EF516E1|nr:exocyst complex component 6 isoform X3 [Ciona intestinalis]|eukprot:XP_026691498.1 exocyst complex component 6 isoform X3 [Ciona intestinalis]
MMEAISEHGSDSLQNSEFDSLGPSPTRNGSEKGNAPKVPKRRSTMKRVASRIQRATSSSSLWGQNNSPVTVDIPTDGEVFQSVVETDGIFKSKEKSKKVAPEIKLTTAADASPTNVVSPKKKSRKGTMTNKMNPFGQRMRRSKSVIEETTIAHQQIAVPIISDELNYQEIAEELKQNELEVNEDRKRAPTQSWVMEVEYGKADIDSVEYGHDIIIQEIESGFFLGPVLRAVYEGNDHAKFLDRLDCRIKQHDRDIERMCNFHYQGFIESITELINVRSDAERLKNQTLIINKELQESGKEVARKSDDLIQCQLQQRNVASAIEKLSMCLPVLQMYAKMCEQMKAGRYYSALKTLEQLEHTHLPLIFQYRFCEIMKNNIPKIREEIKDVSMKELKDFLESVRKNSDKIGMVAMKQVEKERGVHLVSNQQSDKSVSEDESPAEADLPAYDYKDRLRQQKLAQNKLSNVVNGESKWTTANVNQSASPKPQRKLNPFEDISDGEDDKDERNPFENSNPFSTSDNPVDTNPFSVEEHVPLVKPRAGTYVNHSLVDEFTTGADMNSENDGKYEDLSASDLVDFSPVYKCLHIFGLVGAQAQFETYYRTQRKNQARLVLEPPATLQDNPEAFAQYFYQIVGFFVVEDHVLHTATNLISRQVMDDLWEMALSKLVAVLQTDSGYCSDAVSMMKVKNLIVIFADTLKAYGFSVGRLFGLLMEMRDSYGEILLKHWSKKFSDIFDEDNYTAMVLEDNGEVQALFETFPYESPGFENEKFPRKLPFSLFVPRIFTEMKRFILSCLKYCEDLHLSSTEVDDMIRKSTNLLLTRTLASSLQTLVQKPSLGLTELVQIIVNTTHLENSCHHIEDFVHSITGVRVGSAHSAKLVGVSTFKDARNGTEAQIYSKLNSKIDEFFELAEYDWGVKEPQGRASRYLLDLIAFLQHNFEVFTNLPSKVAQTACMSACRHISSSLMELIVDKDIKIVTMAALQQFNLDVMQCELFANSEPVPGFRDGALQMSFVELRQLLDLFLSWDWSSYLADYGSGSSKYLRVSPGTALALLEKIKEERGHRNIFTSLSKQEREKKKLLETVVRQLRGIVNAA